MNSKAKSPPIISRLLTHNNRFKKRRLSLKLNVRNSKNKWTVVSNSAKRSKKLKFLTWELSRYLNPSENTKLKLKRDYEVFLVALRLSKEMLSYLQLTLYILGHFHQRKDNLFAKISSKTLAKTDWFSSMKHGYCHSVFLSNWNIKLCSLWFLTIWALVITF